jgi:hypothetical protein
MYESKFPEVDDVVMVQVRRFGGQAGPDRCARLRQLKIAAHALAGPGHS